MRDRIIEIANNNLSLFDMDMIQYIINSERGCSGISCDNCECVKLKEVIEEEYGTFLSCRTIVTTIIGEENRGYLSMGKALGVVFGQIGFWRLCND